MTENERTRGTRIAKRYLEVVQNGELNLGDRVMVVQEEFTNMNFVPMSEAAKHYGISYNGMKKRVKEGRELFIVCGGSIFVSLT